MLTEKGARKVVLLAVSGAFHSKYMKSAGEEFREFIKDIKLNDAKIPVYTNVDAQPTQKSEDFREKMPRQIYSSVMWYQTIENMAQHGADTFVEIGPGKVLSGLCKKILPECNVFNICDLQSLNNTIEFFEQNIVNQAN
jgi:[acyl-carrier-protein] S-malonyltransferase